MPNTFLLPFFITLCQSLLPLRFSAVYPNAMPLSRSPLTLAVTQPPTLGLFRSAPPPHTDDSYDSLYVMFKLNPPAIWATIIII